MGILHAIGVGRPAEKIPPRPETHPVIFRSLHLIPWPGFSEAIVPRRMRFGWALGWDGPWYHYAVGLAGPAWDNGDWLGGMSWRRRGPLVICRWRRRGSWRSDRRAARHAREG